jgi:hypothetical protein
MPELELLDELELELELELDDVELEEVLELEVLDSPPDELELEPPDELEVDLRRYLKKWSCWMLSRCLTCC